MQLYMRRALWYKSILEVANFCFNLFRGSQNNNNEWQGPPVEKRRYNWLFVNSESHKNSLLIQFWAQSLIWVIVSVGRSKKMSQRKCTQQWVWKIIKIYLKSRLIFQLGQILKSTKNIEFVIWRSNYEFYELC
jgi:hypothetical protein